MITRYHLYQDERRSHTNVLRPRFHLRTSGSVPLFYISPQFPGKYLVFLYASQKNDHLCLIKLCRGDKEVQGVGCGEKLTSSSQVGALVPSEWLNSTSKLDWHFRLLQPWLVDVKFRWNQACWCLCHPSVTWQGLVEKAGSEVQQTHRFRMFLS